MLAVQHVQFRELAHLGAMWTWADGNARENGPTNSLCSTANVGSTMCSTGQPSSFTSAMHSLGMPEVKASQHIIGIRFQGYREALKEAAQIMHSCTEPSLKGHAGALLHHGFPLRTA